MPGLADVVVAEPPVPGQDAILAAIYYQRSSRSAEQGDLAAAQETIEAGELVPALFTGHLSGLSAEALTVVACAGVMAPGPDVTCS